MKKVILTIALMFTISLSASGFCDGWEDGYQAALEDCLRVGVTPICPIEPIGSSGYKTGFGKGYAAAERKHCN